MKLGDGERFDFISILIYIFFPFCFYGLALYVLVAVTTESCVWPRARMKEADADVEVDCGSDAII